MKLLLMSPWFEPIVNKMIKNTPGLYATLNYEQVLGMVKKGEVEAVCIVMGGYNYAKEPCNTITGRKAAAELHEINPDLPILIWNDSDLEGPKEKKATEIFLNSSDSADGDIYGITRDFFGQL